MRRILITGVNSYIGVSFENYMNQWEEDCLIDTLETRDLVPKKEMFIGYDVIFHVAGIVHIKETAANRELYYKVNRDLAIGVAQAAKSAGVSQFIILSSMSVYGLVEGYITKNTKPNPINAYGDSKLQADIAIQEMADDNFKVAIVRPPMVYGKGCKGNYQKLRKLVLRIPFFPSISNRRSMIYIGNLCWFIKEVIRKKGEGIYHPVNKEPVSTSQLVEYICECHGKKIIFFSMFNLLIEHFPYNIIKKIFGSLEYITDDLIDVYTFKESIYESEL